MALEPGVYLGLSNEDYHADPALGSSSIKVLIERPYRYWYWSNLNTDPRRPPKLNSKPLKFGTAYHTLILEPELFDYKIKWGISESQIKGTLGEGEWYKLQAMKDRLLSNARRAELITIGMSEVSFFWRDKSTGIMCKCRWDKFAPEWIIDLKTTRSVATHSMRKDFTAFGYDVSGAMYSIGACELKNMIRDGYKMPSDFSQQFIDEFMSHKDQLFAFMMQEKDAPYMVRCPLLTPDVAACGRDKFHAGLAQYKKYESCAGAWPDDYPDIENIGMDDLPNFINDIPVHMP